MMYYFFFLDTIFHMWKITNLHFYKKKAIKEMIEKMAEE